jgi:uncharacterized protein (UPF0333 family)
MSDVNNNLPNQPSDDINSDTSEHITEQTNQANNDSTYWESNNWQSPYEENNQYGNAPQTSQPVQPATTDNRTTNDLTNNQYQLQKKNKSSKKPLIAVLVILFLLIGSAASAYAFSATVRNSVAMMTKSPKEYFAYVSNNSLEESVDTYFALMEKNNYGKDMATEVSGKLSYDKDTINSLLRSYTGTSLSDIESLVGISLDSIGFDTTSAKKGDDFYSKLGLNFNDIDILTAEIFLNNAEELLLHLPDLSPAYLRQSLDLSELEDIGFDMNSLEEFIDTLRSQKTADFIKRFGAIIINEMDDVKLTKGEVLDVGDLSVKTNVLTVKIYPETLLDIASKILVEAKDDEYILDLLKQFDVSKNEYKLLIDQALSEIQEEYDYLDDTDGYLSMDVYVGTDGKILGYRIRLLDTDETFTLKTAIVEKGNKGAYEFTIKGDSGHTILDVSGDHTIDKGAYTGSGTFNITPSEYDDTVSFKITYKDLKAELKKDKVLVYGNLKLSSYLMAGMEVELDLDVKDNAQLMSIKLNMGTTSLVTFDISTKELDDFKIPKPKADAIYYDAEIESFEYFNTVDIEGYLSNLSDKLGIDLESLFGDLMYMY